MFHQTVLDHLTVLAGAIPKVNTQAPPGSEKILSIVGFVKWIAGAGIIACFLGGIVALPRAGCSTTTAPAAWG
jgi:hypothetical protein